MAQRLEVQLTDDIDGTEIRSGKGETVSFGLDGNSYEIDLKPRRAYASQGPAAVRGCRTPAQGLTPPPVPHRGRCRHSHREGVGSRQWLPGARSRPSAQ